MTSPDLSSPDQTPQVTSTPVEAADLAHKYDPMLRLVELFDSAGQEMRARSKLGAEKGTLLFTIEPEPYRLKFEQAKAAESGAEASLKQAELTLQRQAELLPRQTTTQANYDQALATRVDGHAALV